MNEPAIIDQETPVQPVALNIEAASGSIEIRVDATRKAAVRAEPVTPGDDVALDLIARARVTETADRLDVQFPDPPSPLGGGNVVIGGISGSVMINGQLVTGHDLNKGALRVTAIVPPGSSVTVHAKAADAKVLCDRRDEIPSLNFRSVSGSLYAVGVAQVMATTVSGDVEAQNPRGVQAGTTSGDIEAQNLRGNANLNTVSGDVEVHCATYGAVRANTVSGDIRVTAEPGVRPDVSAHTVSGRKRIGV